jgi:hypothetical protein
LGAGERELATQPPRRASDEDRFAEEWFFIHPPDSNL